MAIKVGVIGAGQVGTTLGRQLLKTPAAFQVKYGSRSPDSEKMKAVLAEQPGATADTNANVVAWADAVLLTTPGAYTTEQFQESLTVLGPSIKGKVLIDTTNPISPYPGLELPWDGSSVGEKYAAALPDTHVFKAFNTIGENQMRAPDGSAVTGEQLTMLYAGPKDSQEVVDKIISGVGFKPVYVGTIRYARNLEAIAELWIHLGVPGVGTSAKFGRDFHLQFIKKP